MEKIEVTDEYLADITSQFEIWASYLNTGVGLVAFTFALACLGTASPAINAWLSIIVISLTYRSGRKFFPAEINNLRSLAKNDKKYAILLNGLMEEHLGFKTNFTKYPLFLFGYLFLFLIAFSGFIKNYSSIFSSYVGT